MTARKPKPSQVLLQPGEVVGSMVVSRDNGSTVTGRCSCKRKTAMAHSHDFVLAARRAIRNGEPRKLRCTWCMAEDRKPARQKRESFFGTKLDGGPGRSA